jgi:hypothetical protein
MGQAEIFHRPPREWPEPAQLGVGCDAGAQLAAADRLFPDHEKLWATVLAGLCERRVTDGDFLELRVGRGRVPHSRPVRLDIGEDLLAEAHTGGRR